MDHQKHHDHHLLARIYTDPWRNFMVPVMMIAVPLACFLGLVVMML